MNWFIEKKRVMFLVFLTCILWGSAFPILKISYEKLALTAMDFNGKILFAGIRFFMASVFLFVFSLMVLKIDMKLTLKEFKKLSLLGVFNTSLLYFFFYNGLANTSGIKAAILQSLSTFIVVLMSHFIYEDDHINKGKILGIVFGFLGIIIVNIERGFGGVSFTFFGEGFMILAGIAGSIGTFMAKSAGRSIHPFKVTAWQMLIGSSFLLAYGLIKTPSGVLNFDLMTGTLLVYLAFLSATAFGIWFMLLKYNKAGEISIYRFLIPIAGSLLTALLVPDEHFTLNILLGLISVSLGIYFVNRLPGRERA